MVIDLFDGLVVGDLLTSEVVVVINSDSITSGNVNRVDRSNIISRNTFANVSGLTSVSITSVDSGAVRKALRGNVSDLFKTTFSVSTLTTMDSDSPQVTRDVLVTERSTNVDSVVRRGGVGNLGNLLRLNTRSSKIVVSKLRAFSTAVSNIEEIPLIEIVGSISKIFIVVVVTSSNGVSGVV